MNRLSPLIVRKVGRHAPRQWVYALPAMSAAIAEPGMLEDLRQFAGMWIAGLVFFGTLFA